jgi:mono/diheme cytochrome c family protein
MNKRKVSWAVLGVVLCGGVLTYALAWHAPMARVARPDVTITTDLVSQGKQLADLGDCEVCHSGPSGSPYAGGLALGTPFGILYTTNITPDRDTGIGGWSYEAFRRAMKKGVARDGHLLYPAFPYTHYTHVGDDDLKALYAFLMTRRAVNAPATRNQLIFPLRFRPLLAFWNLLYLREGDGGFAGSTPEARGHYLMEGLGHCSACHTPINAMGGEEESKYLAGGSVDGWDAPPLNALLNSQHPWTREQLVSYLETGLSGDHGAAAGPMRPVTDHLAHAAKSDVAAIASYLLSIQKTQNLAANTTVAPSTPNLAHRIADGEVIFNGACGACHDVASPMVAYEKRPVLALSTALNSPSANDAVLTVLQGLPWPATPRVTTYMPPFAGVMDDQKVADVLTYLRVVEAKQTPWPDVQKTVATLRKEQPP